MQVVFVRHGERRRNESDPELTSAGRRMASETGAWLAARGFSPALILTTPTARTRQTSEELALRLEPAPIAEVPELPETRAAWDALVLPLAARLAGRGGLLLVGHHPTLHFLAEHFGPTPVPVPRHHFAAALVLEPDAVGWVCAAAWPGRAG